MPTEWEWQQAATGGDAQREYPWEGKWDPARCNSSESRLNRTTAVGVYPTGATLRGVLDMAGNVDEWCLNKYDKPNNRAAMQIDTSSGGRVLRGGTWNYSADGARCPYRNWTNFADDRYSNVGFRLAQDL